MPPYTFHTADDLTISEQDLQAVGQISEDAFHTAEDQAQMPINDESRLWILKNIPFCLNIVKCDGQVVGSTLMLPTPKSAMNSFLKGEMTERKLFFAVQAQTELSWECLYLAGGVILKEHRRQGLGFISGTRTIEYILAHKNSRLTAFSWPTTEDGRLMQSKLEVYFRNKGLPFYQRSTT